MGTASLNTPIGNLGIWEQDGAITKLTWSPPATTEPTPLLNEAIAQLCAYFEGRLKRPFDLPLAPKGTAFERSVYEKMLAIPFGETRTYGAIAQELGTFGQPVGRACGSNPIPVIIPCHRVLSAKGLGGYSGHGGVEMKTTLLKLEDGYPFLV